MDISSDVHMEEREVRVYASLQHHASAIVTFPLELQGGCPRAGQGMSPIGFTTQYLLHALRSISFPCFHQVSV